MPDNRPYKAILVDPFAETITEERVYDYTSITKLLQVQHFTAVNVNDKGETCYVDDEGLINGTEFGVKYKFYPSILAGRALFVGSTPSGDTADTTMTRASVHNNILGVYPIFSSEEDLEDAE
jgi:hypothetical protein